MDTFILVIALTALVICSAFLGYGAASKSSTAYCKEGRPMLIDDKIYTCKEVTWQNQ